MDLNLLLANHQRALMNEKASTTASDRATYFDLVDYYAERIRKYRVAAGLPQYTWDKNHYPSE